MSYAELYRIGALCRTWRQMVEEHIYRSIKLGQNTISVKIGDSNRAAIELFAQSYDPVNRIIEFRPRSDASPVSLSTFSSFQRRMQIHFNKWAPEELPEHIESMSPKDQELILFHMRYNPALERMYELPTPCIPKSASSCDPHYVGDKGLILSFDYVYPNVPHHVRSQQQPSYYAYHTQPRVPASPCMQIHWLRVTLAWVVSGMNPAIPVHQIYADKYEHLGNALARYGLYKYDPLSEPILTYIVETTHHQEQCKPSSFPTVHSHSEDRRDNGEAEVPCALRNYVQAHTHECHTRLSRLQHMLEGAGVDARVLWKYPFAKSLVIGNGSLLGEEDVVRRIQDSEDQWRMKKLSLARKLQV
ncbi:hypothetical protein EC973_004198 [Apophysomyces ossiformis]|uniref:Uncharacterized protein n=1 Tax=Apophysomyces ossiformis TaxID=679940 RepID=A0A8H7BX54_9FUNG|nr:hypothetical protein EC973_004198 [Apophysomyces ossiformis]